MRIAFTGGGTGGHISPIVATAREIKRIAEESRILDIELFYFGPEGETPELLNNEEIVSSRISAGKVRRYFSLLNLTDIFKTIIGVFQALWKMFIVMPDVVFAKGGYGSFPVLLVARLYRIPVIIHASDAIPGVVEKWAGKWARRVAISFSRAIEFFPEENTALTGVPLRKGIIGGSEAEAREVIGVLSARPVLFITGGSQGAETINNNVAQILKELNDRYEIIHQTGGQNFEDVFLEATAILAADRKAAPGIPGEKFSVIKSIGDHYHLAPFLNESQMRSAYFLADIVISRAGATSIFEIAAHAKPAILIPLKDSAQDHQRANAYEYAERGGATVIETDNLTPSVLLNEIQKLMADSGKRKAMSEAAQKFARLDAATTLAEETLKLGLH
ncbi:MAG: UDP-N-acetylglucosamine--N-acetylmuramyl-(pentapeptide) pyrophosphoryl-undecaprenol N-acetylglucosamine transferase [Candidatus Sungbacteria bacterium]|nr:UDP-N-acetylglucosamine--N-acetylmuramyl-(pentapeptide) pyrophosphoryl-undecaprenol N-acetylglucosamine transferase [Candidatus Sungbacteria bacterium]